MISHSRKYMKKDDKDKNELIMWIRQDISDIVNSMYEATETWNNGMFKKQNLIHVGEPGDVLLSASFLWTKLIFVDVWRWY